MRPDPIEAPGEKIPQRESLHDEVHGSGHGGTEMGWLVSYADMMTLLFGLFVILFSLASDKKKDADEVMKQVSQKYFSQQSPVDSVAPKAPETPSSAPIKTTSESEAPKSNDDPEKEALLAQIKAELDQAKSEKDAWSEKLKKIEKEKKSLQRQIANVEDQKIEQANEKARAFESVKKELAEQREENKKLQENLNKRQAPTQNYMMVLLTWETEKHDIDLQIINPHQKTFNFKRRQLASEPGHFELDSRFGPGIEMWKAENFTPGEYRAKTSFYSKNGNDVPAKAHLTVITNLATYNSPPIELKTLGQVVEVPFKIDAEGAVQFEK